MAVLCLASILRTSRSGLAASSSAIPTDERPSRRGISRRRRHGCAAQDSVSSQTCADAGAYARVVHGGPFANIAHGCNSLTATRLALKLGEYAGPRRALARTSARRSFWISNAAWAGSNRRGGRRANRACAQAPRRRGEGRADAGKPRRAGTGPAESHAACGKHPKRVRPALRGGLNAFPSDTPAELMLLQERCRALDVPVALSEVWAKGGEGGRALAEEVCRIAEGENAFSQSYELSLSIEEKDRRRRAPRLSRGRRRADPSGKAAGGEAHAARLWRASGLHGEDAVFFFGQCRAARRAKGVHRHGAKPPRQRGRGLHRRAHRATS